jgi:hypothetical protein
MSVSITVSPEIKTRLDKIRRPGESYEEVIEQFSMIMMIWTPLSVQDGQKGQRKLFKATL